jgi:hypothetical protein
MYYGKVETCLFHGLYCPAHSYAGLTNATEASLVLHVLLALFIASSVLQVAHQNNTSL